MRERKRHTRRFALAGAVAVMSAVGMVPRLTATATAHDAGLSSSVVVLSKDGATATLRIHDVELAHARDVAAEDVVVVRSGHDTIRPAHAGKVIDSDGDAVFSLSFRVPREAVLEIEVPLLGRLPRGHKHLIEVRSSEGRPLASAMIGAAAPRMALPPP